MASFTYKRIELIGLALFLFSSIALVAARYKDLSHDGPAEHHHEPSHHHHH